MGNYNSATDFHFRRNFWFCYFGGFLLLMLALADVASAQSGGFPSRPKFQSATIVGEVETNANFIADGPLPYLRLYRTDAATDEKITQFYQHSTGQTRFSICPDSGTGCGDFIALDRTGTTRDLLTLTATDIVAAGALEVESTGPLIYFDKTNGAANNRLSLINGNSDGALSMQHCDDAKSSCTVFFATARTNNATDSLTLTATTVNTVGNLQEGGADVDLANSRGIATKNTAETRTSATLVDDASLVLTIPSAGYYRISGHLLATSLVSADHGLNIRLAYSGTTGKRTYGTMFPWTGAYTTINNLIDSNYLLVHSSTAIGVYNFDQTLQFTTGGTLTLQWACTGSCANGTRLGDNSLASYIAYERLSE